MNSDKGPIFYEAQERAMAPGVAGDWPKVIKAPQSKHGRLIKLGPALSKAIAKLIDDYHDKFGCGDCGDLVKRRRLCPHCQLMVCGHCWHHVHRCEPGHKKSECRDLPKKKR